MKSWLKILIILILIALVSADILWWIPFHELSKGQLAIIGDSNSGRGIYLLNPLFRSWHRLPTDNLFPWRIAWSPNGKKIAFTYSTSHEMEAIVGVAILNLETRKVYVAPSNEGTDAVTWTPDGQSLIFPIYKNRLVAAFMKLDIQTSKLESIPFAANIQPQYFSVEHLEIAQNNDYVMDGSSGGYIAPPNLSNLRRFTQGVGEDLNGFFLTPDRSEITIACDHASFCNYNIDTNKLTAVYKGNLRGCCVFNNGNWSYDEKDVIYLMQGSEGDPQYIILLDTVSKLNFVVYKNRSSAISWVLQLAWYSAK